MEVAGWYCEIRGGSVEVWLLGSEMTDPVKVAEVVLMGLVLGLV